MDIKPLSDRVVIAPAPAAQAKIGSLIVPDTAQEKPLEGTVKAVGPGRTEKGQLVPMTVKVGDRVLYGKYTGTEIKRDGQDLLIISEGDLLALLD